MKDQRIADNLALYTRCLFVTGIMAIGAALCVWPMAGIRFSLGVLVSAAWSLLNLALLRQVVIVLGHPQRTTVQKGWMTFLLLTVKFPLLYTLGYFILASRRFPLGSLLLGLSLWIVSFLGLAVRRVTLAGVLLLGFLTNALASEEGLASQTPAAHMEGMGMPELPNLVTLMSRSFHGGPVGHFLHRWETSLFTGILLACLLGIAWAATRRKDLLPSHKLQNATELLVDGFNEFVCGILGPTGREFTPFLGTLFLYIWISNLAGLVPLLKSPTTGFRSLPGFPVPIIPITTIPLALAVFGYVQWTAIRHRGFFGYLDHLAGEPRNVFTWLVSPLMVVLHLLGEIFTKPLSLSFRLFGNIWSEDAVLAVLVGMGFVFLWVEFPLVWLSLILSTVQAVVFTLLSTIYIAMVLPHEEDHPNEKGV